MQSRALTARPGVTNMLTVLGSIIVDSIFSVPALPRPGETVLADSLYLGPGGKGANQAVAAAKAGAEVSMVGSVGKDPLARFSLAAFEAAGVETSHIIAQAGPTGSAAVQVDSEGRNQISVAPAANHLTRTSQMSEALWNATSTLLLQMEIPIPEIERAIAEGKKRGIKTLLNLAPALPLAREALASLSYLIVNEVELAMLGDHLKLADNAQTALAPERLAEDVQKTLGVALVVTLGADGALYLDEKERLHVSALSIDPVDTTGAGDAFCGVFAASLDQGLAIETALQRGTIAGSLTCLKTGAQESQPSAAEIAAALDRV